MTPCSPIQDLIVTLTTTNQNSGQKHQGGDICYVYKKEGYKNITIGLGLTGTPPMVLSIQGVGIVDQNDLNNLIIPMSDYEFLNFINQ